jgi:hypothetical protein
MYESPARNLRTAERFLLAPPMTAHFGGAAVSICDISAKGARFLHEKPLEMGAKSILKVPLDGRPSPVALEAVVVWTQGDGKPGRYVSGVRTYASQEVVDGLLLQLETSRRSNRIEELRASDRFHVAPALMGRYAGQPVTIENLSARGARIAIASAVPRGTTGELRFSVPDANLEIAVAAQVAWTGVKAVHEATSYRAGLTIAEKPELLRLAVAHLCEMDRASLDTQSLGLKLKILRARARQFAPVYGAIEASGIPAEQYLLIQGVREELRLNPEEALHWYRRARITIADPSIRSLAPPIATHPDALAVWEYLDRSIDPSIVGRAFELPQK